MPIRRAQSTPGQGGKSNGYLSEGVGDDLGRKTRVVLHWIPSILADLSHTGGQWFLSPVLETSTYPSSRDDM